MNISREAQNVLQQAYDIDLGKTKGSLNPAEVLQNVGVMPFHVCYYDSGLAQNDEIQQHLHDFPNGQLACLIRGLRDARLSDYSPKILNQMYGLEE